MTRPTLFLLPGLLCDDVTWAAQRAALAGLADIRIPSLYGFCTLQAMAEAVLTDAPARFAVAGHSMGARVALEILRAAPDRVTHLALLDTGTHTIRPGERDQRQALVDLARTQGMTALAERWLPPMVHPQAPKSLLATLTAMVERATPDIFAGQVQALLDRPETESLLPTVTCPILVGVGRQDAWSPLAQHERIASLIPHARLVVFEDAGHMAPMEAPDAVSQALRDWLASDNAPQRSREDAA